MMWRCFLLSVNEIKQWLVGNKIIVILGGVIAVLLLFIVLSERQEDSHVMPLSMYEDKDTSKAKENHPTDKEDTTQVDDRISKEVKIDIKGAVKYSGVYPAQTNQVINDLVMLAQPLENADLDAVNLAASVQDEMVVYVPYKGEVKENKYEMYKQSIGSHVEHNTLKQININTSDIKALEEIPGIGPKKAQEIIMYREQNGGFKSKEELKEIKGIGDKTFESLKDFIEI